MPPSIPALPPEQCHRDQLVVRALHVRLPEVHDVPGHGERETLHHDQGREDFAMVSFISNISSNFINLFDKYTLLFTKQF